MGKLEADDLEMKNGENSELNEEKMEISGEVENELERLEVAFMRRWNHEKDGEIIELGEEAGEDEERWQRSLIGKLQTKRWFGEDDIKKELIRNWNISNKFEFMMVAEGICIITFSNEIDFIFVLENGPWDIHGYVMSFKRWSKDIVLESFEFPFFPMWVQVFGLPLERHNKENIMKVGAIFGEVLMVDSVGNAEGRLPYTRVQVMFNVHFPIKIDAMVRLSGGKIAKVTFKYERLPLFCHFCGMIGHDYGVCKEMKEGIRRINRELTREELRKIKKYSFLQKARSYKFGAGIQVRHTIEVDPLAEMEIKDHQFRRWKDEKQKEGERLKKELTRSNVEGNFSLTKSGPEGKDVLSEPKMITDKTCLYKPPGFKVVRDDVQLMPTESKGKGEGTDEKKEDVPMLTPERGRSIMLDKQGGEAEVFDGFTAMDFSPNPGKTATSREVRSVDMTDASGGTTDKAGMSRHDENGYCFSACKKLQFHTCSDESGKQTQAQRPAYVYTNPKLGSFDKTYEAQTYITPTKNPIASKKPKTKNKEIACPPKDPSPKFLKRKLESDQNLVILPSFSSPTQAQIPEESQKTSTNGGEKDGKREESREVLENRKPKSQKRKSKTGYRHKSPGSQTAEMGLSQGMHSTEEELKQTGDKRRKIIHRSTNSFKPSDLLFSGNFKRVWLKYLADPNMRRSYVGTSSRNERNERVIKGNVAAGSINMKVEDRRNFSQMDFDELIEKMRTVRGMSVFDPESVKIGKEVSALKEKGFSFAKALTINGEHTTEEADEDYALFLIAYAEDTEKIADEKFEEEEYLNITPSGDSKVAGSDQPPST
ncbi:Ta11-like non-ltr retrotransposon [Thalictrum thalictroides]|uniref:Ta11-like non-ltr retrotransposon n=1 Tax=Thalictrum thalictroides TaxID=46969 RepID=A0A7J6VFM8_THATH|nr:Ta11-like non-ltr retrotransposon [Thalictrum thalictroides]